MNNHEKEHNFGEQQIGDQLDQANLQQSLAELGAEGFALQQRANQLVQNPEAFLALLEDFETMKTETLAAIKELWGKVNAVGRERLLAAKEMLRMLKVVTESAAYKLLQDAKNTAEGVGALLFTHKGRITLSTLAMMIISACGELPDPVKTALAPDVVYAAENSTSTPTAIPTEKATRTPTRTPTKTPSKTSVPSNTPAKTETTVVENDLAHETMAEAKARFVELGLDKKNEIVQGLIYGILDETSMKTKLVETTVDGKEFTSAAQVEIEVFVDGKWVKGKMLDMVSRETGADDNSYYSFSLHSGSITIDSTKQTENFAKGILKQQYEQTPGKYVIVKIDLNSKIPGVSDIFKGIYPSFAGEFQIIKVKGYGDMLIPATYFDYPEATDGWYWEE